MFLFIFLYTIVSIIIWNLYDNFTKANYWKYRNIVHEKPWNILSKIVLDKRGFYSIIDYYNKYYDEKFYGIFRLNRPELVIKDPELAQHILVKDAHYFRDRNKGAVRKAQLLTQHLLNLEGDVWKSTRNRLSPIFTPNKLKEMFYLMTDKGDELRKYINNGVDNKSCLDVYDLMSRYTIDVIASCGFGIDINSIVDPSCAFKTNSKRIFDFDLWKKFLIFVDQAYPRLLEWMSWKLVDDDIEQFFVNVMKYAVQERVKTGIRRKDMVDLFLEIKKDDVKDGLIIDENFMTAQAFVFFVAGYETTSTTNSYTLLELALNPEIKEKVHDEMDKILEKHNGKITYESIGEMTYLDMVTKESLRKHSPILSVWRTCTTPYRLPDTDLIIEKGTFINIPIYFMHRDSKYFPDPEKFLPERFNQEEVQKRHPMTYMPFGDGFHVCIGKRFAQLQSKVGLVSLLRDYTVEVCEKTERDPEVNGYTFIRLAKNGVWLKLEKRRQRGIIVV